MKSERLVLLFSALIALILGCEQPSSVADTSNADVATAKSSLSIGFAPGDSLTSVTSNLSLPTSGSNGVTISWSSSSSVITSTGIVTRPLFGQPDASVTLTASLHKKQSTDSKSLILTVKAAAQTFTVTYDGNDGTGSVTDATQYGVGQSVVPKANGFTKLGYSFKEWNSLKAGGGTVYTPGVSFNITSDLTLFAQWTANQYTVSFDSQGGSAVADLGAVNGAILAQPINPTKNGNSFGGWYKDSGFVTAWDFANDTVTSNITLYAHWIVSGYTVTFDSQGGSAVQAVDANYNTSIGRPSDPSKTGSTFAGWYKDSGYATAWVFGTDKVTADTTLYAKWTVLFKVTYDPSSWSGATVSGSPPLDSNYYASGDSATVLGNVGNLSAPQFSFVAWNTAVDGSGTLYFPNDTISNISADVTLYPLRATSQLTYAVYSNKVYVTAASSSVDQYNIFVPQGVSVIDTGAFNNKHVVGVVLPSSVTSIRAMAFNGSFLSVISAISYSDTGVKIPDTVLTIGNSAFAYCTYVTSAVLPNKLSAVSVSLFAMSGLATVTIPASVTEIQDLAFNHSKLASVAIPPAVTTIGIAAFAGTKLTSVDLPASLRYLGNGAFGNIATLTNVHVRSLTPPLPISSTVNTNSTAGFFANCSPSLVIYIPTGTLAEYSVASGWSTYASQLVEE